MLRNTFIRFSAVPECALSIANGIATVTLNRPPRLNALGRTLRAELEASLRTCATAPAADVRVVVLQSAVPKFFCVGADLKERKEMPQEEARAFVDSLRSTFTLLEDIEVPTICAVQGAALGGGLELALAADIRVAGAQAKFAIPETGLAIIPGAGGSFRLPKVIGLSRAQLMAFTADPIGAEEAARIGLVASVVEDANAEAQRLAQRIARNGPVAVRAVKKAMRNSFWQSRDAGLKAEAEGYQRVLVTQDRLEGLKAFAEKRPPQYKGE
jgi:methylglutaconyl-CoA hydratase